MERKIHERRRTVAETQGRLAEELAAVDNKKLEALCVGLGSIGERGLQVSCVGDPPQMPDSRDDERVVY